MTIDASASAALQKDMRHAPRHIPERYGANDAEVRYEHLLASGFSAVQADHVFELIDLPSVEAISARLADLRELGFADPVKMITSLPAILGYAIENIRNKIADLRELGFADPVKMITSSPAILGYARGRMLLCCQIVAALDDRDDRQLARLINKPRAKIDAVAAAKPKTWRDVLNVMKEIVT